MKQPEQPEWRIEDAPVPYPIAVAAMEARVAAIRSGDAPELVWLLEHPSTYTAGTSARPADLLTPERFPVHATGRGGQYTYHGPGQRVVYAVLDLKRRGIGVHRYVRRLEDWAIRALARFDVEAERREGRVGVWVVRHDRPPHPNEDGTSALAEDKIAAIGVRVRHWVAFHGLAINVSPDLAHFSGIVPCGIAGHGVTSLRDLGKQATMAEIDTALRAAFDEVFAPRVGIP